MAKQILITVIDTSRFQRTKKLKINNIMNETRYSWLLNNSTANQIQEYRNIFNVNDIQVSAEMFVRYLLCVCHKKSGRS